MFKKNEILILDAEIKHAIPMRDTPRVPGIEYCNGWHDFKGMGISVVCGHLVKAGTAHVFMDDNLDDLAYMISQVGVVAGFNSARFDEPLLEACWGIHIPEKKSYDFKYQIVKAAGGNPMERHNKGYSQERCCGANTGDVKKGHGALAPVWYQQGHLGRVVGYCLNDVDMLVGLNRMMSIFMTDTPNFKDPVTGKYISVALPGDK